MKKKIICTLGPSSFKSSILKEFKNQNVFIYRINLSHTKIEALEKQILFLKRNKIKNICIDTEGAQIRTTKVKKKFLLKKNHIIKIGNENSLSNNRILNLYPKFNHLSCKINSIIYVGFENLVLKVIKKDKKNLYGKVIEQGYLESNKGVHFNNQIKLPALTDKDKEAIKIAKKNRISFYAMSFVNFGDDVKEMRKIIGSKTFLISKIETKNALNNLKQIANYSDALLIDRGDLSRYIPIYQIPIVQEKISIFAKKFPIPLYVATNLLESMIKNFQPTRAESHDIYSTLKQGVQGLVLAAETAIGLYPTKCVLFLKSCIKSYNKKNKNFFK